MTLSGPQTAHLQRPTGRSSRRGLAAVFLLAVSLRVGFIVLWGGVNAPLRFHDAKEYWSMAQSLAAGEGLFDARGYRATRMPAYPAFLGVFVRLGAGLGAVRISQAVLGSLAAVAIGWLGIKLAGRTVGLLAGVAVAVDPFNVFFSNLLLTETLFVAALCVAWVAFRPLIESGDSVRNTQGRGMDTIRAPSASAGLAGLNDNPLAGARGSDELPSYLTWLLAGAAFALCVYLRPSSVGLLPALIALILVRRWREREAWLGSVALVMVLVVSLLPWAWRNQAVTGEWCWLTNRFGISLWDGLGSQADGSSNLAATHDLPAVQGLSEGEWNRYFRARALREARADIPRVLRLAWIKVRRTWNLFPNVAEYQSRAVRLISAVWMGPLVVCTLVGLWTLRRRPWPLLLLILPAAYFTVLHTVFVGSVRYRLPGMPFLELIAAAGLAAMIATIRRRVATPSAEGRPETLNPHSMSDPTDP